MIRRLLRTTLVALTMMWAPLACATVEEQADAPPALFDAPALSDAELADQRGGFMLPNGVEIALAATLTTTVNGDALLQTVFRVGDNGASVASTGALTDQAGRVIAASVAGTVNDTGAVKVTVARAALTDIEVSHIVGDRIVATIANTGNDRIINQDITIDVVLSNVGAFQIGSTLARVQGLGVEASAWRAVGG